MLLFTKFKCIWWSLHPIITYLLILMTPFRFQMKQFLVVEFTELSEAGEKEISVIRSSWYNPVKKEAFWPPFVSSERVAKALINNEKPSKSWRLYNITRTFYETDDFKKAKDKLALFETQSDVGTEIENIEDDGVNKRKHRNPVRFGFNESDGDSSDAGKKKSKKKRYSKTTPKKHSPKKALPKAPIFPPTGLKSKSVSNSNSCQNISKEQTTVRTEASECTDFAKSKYTDTDDSESPIHKTYLDANFAIEVSNEVSNPPIFLTENNGTRIRSQEVNKNSNSSSSQLPTRHDITIPFKALEQMLKNQEYIKRQVELNSRILNKILVEHSKNSKVDLDQFELQIPANSVDELDAVEKFASAGETKAHLISYLGGLGGKSVGDCARKVMASIVTDTLGTQLNWAGHNKKGFKTLNLRNVVIAAVRTNERFKLAKEDEIEKSVKDWLKYSKTRLSNRKLKDLHIMSPTETVTTLTNSTESDTADVSQIIDNEEGRNILLNMM